MTQNDYALHTLPVNIADEMKQSYMDYAMSVIVGRALPDVRDGMKPANRRVLYTMHEMGLVPGKPFRKSAGIVGDVMGKYHPHGDAPVYDTMVRMAQPFNMRAILVDGHGNFGSVDGDRPAAMRYTEARLTRIAVTMMADLDKETVEFQPNYDDRLEEPTVLPTILPALLVNGSSGIAVGMATNIPPHNLGEVVDGLVYLVENQSLPLDERVEGLLERVLGPDFPTGGFILGKSGIRQAYLTGRGSVTMRARAEIEKRKGDKEAIVVTEIPFQVNKARVIEKIAELWREKKIDGITEVRDESDRRGMRMVVDIRKGESAQVILNQLYKQTQLQDTFGISMLAIVHKRPRVLSLIEVCDYFIGFRREVVRKRIEFELRKAEARAHILRGYVIALDNLDAVISLIRNASSPQDARTQLIERFALSELQAVAILELQLQRLTGLERQKIMDELAEIEATIARLKKILGSKHEIDLIVVSELKGLKETHGDARRTELIDAPDDISIEDTIADEDVAISITHDGYIKRTPMTIYRSQRRGGRGRVGMKTKEEDFVENLFVASTHSYVLIFTNRGRLYWLKVHEIPDVGPQAKGKAVVNLVRLQEGEKIAALVACRDFEAKGYIVLATRKGVIKKTELASFSNPRPGGIIALGVEEDDALIDAMQTTGADQLLLSSRGGMAIRFDETDVRPMGRTAYGVKGIDLDEGDTVVSLEVVREAGRVLTVCENGFGKCTPIEEYRIQGRGGKGIINIKTEGRNGAVIGVKFMAGDEGVMLITGKGMIIRTRSTEISTMGRNTQGVRLIQTDDGDQLVSIARLAEKDESTEPNDTPEGEAPPETPGSES